MSRYQWLIIALGITSSMLLIDVPIGRSMLALSLAFAAGMIGEIDVNELAKKRQR